MYSALDFKHPNQQGAQIHESVRWNAGEATVGNTSRASKRLQLDDGRDTGEVQSKSSRPPYHGDTKVLYREETEPVVSMCTTMKTKLDPSQIHRQIGYSP